MWKHDDNVIKKYCNLEPLELESGDRLIQLNQIFQQLMKIIGD